MQKVTFKVVQYRNVNENTGMQYSLSKKEEMGKIQREPGFSAEQQYSLRFPPDRSAVTRPQTCDTTSTVIKD